MLPPSAARVLVAAACLLLCLGPYGPASSAPSSPGDRPPGSFVPVEVSMNDQAKAGRITSREARCERRRGLAVLLVQPGSVVQRDSAVSDRQGRWKIDEPRPGSADDRATAVVPGDERCELAQSRYLTVPATRAAHVRISLQGQTDTTTGRVRSDRRACVDGVAVAAFTREGPHAPWQLWDYGATEADGSYTLTGIGDFAFIDSFTTVVVGSRACSLAQSRILTRVQ